MRYNNIDLYPYGNDVYFTTSYFNDFPYGNILKIKIYMIGMSLVFKKINSLNSFSKLIELPDIDETMLPCLMDYCPDFMDNFSYNGYTLFEYLQNFGWEYNDEFYTLVDYLHPDDTVMINSDLFITLSKKFSNIFLEIESISEDDEDECSIRVALLSNKKIAKYLNYKNNNSKEFKNFHGYNTINYLISCLNNPFDSQVITDCGLAGDSYYILFLLGYKSEK